MNWQHGNATIHQLMTTIQQFDSLYQLLPPETESILVNETGQTFSALEPRAWPNFLRAKIGTATAIHQTIRECAFSGPITFYGADVSTDYQYVVDDHFTVLRRWPSPFYGDGKVTQSSAVEATPGTNQRPVHRPNSSHVRLPSNRDVLHQIERLLLAA